MKRYAEVIAAWCRGCGCCVRACPAEALKLGLDVVEVLLPECVGCGSCERACPFSAIRMREIEED